MTARGQVSRVGVKDGKFRIQIGSDWPQVGQIWDFLRSVSVHFDAPRQNVLKLIFKKTQICPTLGQSSPRQNVLKLILESPRFVPFGANLT